MQLEALGAESAAVRDGLKHALVALPLATALGAALALRPRKRGAPPRSPAVVETQIVLAVIGALVMIVVGSSLARAFGVVGAAGLVRYRAKIEDPKDAAVMLSTLAVGLACGVDALPIATFAAVFIIALLFTIEWFEPRPVTPFVLNVKAKDAPRLQPRVEELLRRRRWRYDLRAASPEEFSFSVNVPQGSSKDAMSTSIMAADKEPVAVEWTPDKPPKAMS